MDESPNEPNVSAPIDTAVASDAAPVAAPVATEDQANPAGALDALLADPDKAEEGESGADAEAPEPVVPEAYEFKASEGFAPLSGEMADAVSSVFKELKLTQESAEKLMPLGEAIINQHDQQRAREWEAGADAWLKAARDDPEYGGEKLPANIARANAFMDRFASNELRTYLTETRLINHPELVRMLVKAGEAMSEDRGASDSSQGGKELSDGERMYQYAGHPQLRSK